MQADQEFSALMTRVLDRDEPAARELLQRYQPYLLRAVRRQLSPLLRPQFDSLDFAQDVWVSFFNALPRAAHFNSPKELAAFLTTLARNKVIETVRQRLRTQKYSVNREQSLDDSKQFDKEQLASKQPTPSDIVCEQEQWDDFLRRQPVVYRRIFILLREGKSSAEIAKELRISSRTVRRVAERLLPKSGS